MTHLPGTVGQSLLFTFAAVSSPSTVPTANIAAADVPDGDDDACGSAGCLRRATIRGDERGASSGVRYPLPHRQIQ